MYYRPKVKSVYPPKKISYFSTKTYVMNTQKNRLNETTFERQKLVLKLIGKKIITIYNFCLSKPVYLQETNGEQRDEMLSWLIFLNGRFHFTPETLALTISIMDRFLSTIKVSCRT